MAPRPSTFVEGTTWLLGLAPRYRGRDQVVPVAMGPAKAGHSGRNAAKADGSWTNGQETDRRWATRALALQKWPQPGSSTSGRPPRFMERSAKVKAHARSSHRHS